MIITVVGSFQKEIIEKGATDEEKDKTEAKNKKNSETFEKACIAIGKALGEKNNRLIVAHRFDKDGNPSQSAEAFALKGLQKTTRRDNFEEVPHHSGDPQLKAHTEAVERSDAVILIGGKEGTYAAGLSALLRRKMIITIPAFGGSGRDLCEIEEINRTVIDELRNLDTSIENWEETLTRAITSEVDSYPRILIIHGRGDDGTKLRDKIWKGDKGKTDKKLEGLIKPIIMDLSGKGAVSVPEVFEKFASRVSATIAIVTADDIGGFARRDDRGDENIVSQEDQKVAENAQDANQAGEYKNDDSSRGLGLPPLPATELRLVPRARENVWVEVGWFWGRLGRQRIFLWLEDEVPLPSDLQGAAWSRGKFTQAWPQIRKFIINLREGDSDLMLTSTDTMALQPEKVSG